MNFRRWREEKLILLQLVHVGLKLRKLRRADHAITPNYKRRTNLKIPMLARVQVEHELDQGTLQPRPGPGETDKSAATEFRCALQIKQLQSASDGNVIERICNFRFFPPFAHYPVRAWIVADRNVRVRQIRNLQEEIPLLFVGNGRLFTR